DDPSVLRHVLVRRDTLYRHALPSRSGRAASAPGVRIAARPVSSPRWGVGHSLSTSVPSFGPSSPTSYASRTRHATEREGSWRGASPIVSVFHLDPSQCSIKGRAE